jgi:hypothetical protein
MPSAAVDRGGRGRTGGATGIAVRRCRGVPHFNAFPGAYLFHNIIVSYFRPEGKGGTREE